MRARIALSLLRQKILAAHCAGDPDAFAEIVRRHRDRLWAVALRTTGNPEEASDALQDAFISAYRRADSFRGDSAVTTWLHRIVVNAALDRLRRRAVRTWVPLPDEGAGETSATLVDEALTIGLPPVGRLAARRMLKREEDH